MIQISKLSSLSKEELVGMVLRLQRDNLTHFYKREMLKEFEMDSKTHVVAFVDINGLKAVNDLKGHKAGDRYILSVAKSINNCIRKEDVVIRYGGDEFLILFTSCSIDQARKIVSRIRHASCGVACHRSLSTAIKLADKDMYSKKKQYYSKKLLNLEV